MSVKRTNLVQNLHHEETDAGDSGGKGLKPCKQSCGRAGEEKEISNNKASRKPRLLVMYDDDTELP